jgi:hypothetical protein
MLDPWLKQPEFDALRRWLLAQGFVIKRAFGPRPWGTDPIIKFNATVAQIERAFHVTVMRGPGRVHRCYTVFHNLRMPARFAGKGATYIEGFSFYEGAVPGLRTQCHK